MSGNNKKFEKSVKYWRDGALSDFKAVEGLFKNGSYPQCLFFCHLSVEKLLKALVVKETKEPASYIHDLRRLSEIAKIELDR